MKASTAVKWLRKTKAELNAEDPHNQKKKEALNMAIKSLELWPEAKRKLLEKADSYKNSVYQVRSAYHEAMDDAYIIVADTFFKAEESK